MRVDKHAVVVSGVSRAVVVKHPRTVLIVTPILHQSAETKTISNINEIVIRGLHPAYGMNAMAWYQRVNSSFVRPRGGCGEGPPPER